MFQGTQVNVSVLLKKPRIHRKTLNEESLE